jgi:hypothetical protein
MATQLPKVVIASNVLRALMRETMFASRRSDTTDMSSKLLLDRYKSQRQRPRQGEIEMLGQLQGT